MQFNFNFPKFFKTKILLLQYFSYIPLNCNINNIFVWLANFTPFVVFYDDKMLIFFVKIKKL